MATMFNDGYYDADTNDYLTDFLYEDVENSDAAEIDDYSIVTDYSDLIEEVSASTATNNAEQIFSNFDAEIERLRQEKLDLENVVAAPEFDGNCECPFCFTHSPEQARERGFGAYGKIERWNGDDKYKKVYYVLRLLYEGYSVSEAAKLMVAYFDESNLVRMSSRISNISRGNSHRAITGLKRSRSLCDHDQLSLALDTVRNILPDSDALFNSYDQEYQDMLRTPVG